MRVLGAGASVEQHHRLGGHNLARGQQRTLGGEARNAFQRSEEPRCCAHASGLIEHRVVADDALIVPLTGIIDNARANRLISGVLERISLQHTRTVILDVTGVPVVDTLIAAALLRTAGATKLMGVELTGLRTAATLRMGLLLPTPRQRVQAAL